MTDTALKRAEAPPEAVESRFARLPETTADRDEFAALVAAEGPRVARLATRLLGWRAEVEDVVQEVFTRAFRARLRFRGASSTGTWLTRIAINVCRSHLRRQRVRSLLARPAPGRNLTVTGEPAARRERDEVVRHAVAGLPLRAREVVVLRYLEGLAVREIAGLLNVRINTIEARLSRARRTLRARLGDLWQEEP